jgi:hypothetical protein
MDLDRIAEIAADYAALADRFAHLVRRLRAAENGLPDVGIRWGSSTATEQSFTFLGSACRLRFELVAFETGSTFGILIAERLSSAGTAKPGATMYFDSHGKVFLTQPLRNPLSPTARADLRKVATHLLTGLVPRVGLDG